MTRQDEAKERVLAVWPDANIHSSGHSGKRAVYSHTASCYLSGWMYRGMVEFREQQAWADAASKLSPVEPSTLRQDVERLRAILGAWKDRPDPLADLQAIHEGRLHDVAPAFPGLKKPWSKLLPPTKQPETVNEYCPTCGHNSGHAYDCPAVPQWVQKVEVNPPPKDIDHAASAPASNRPPQPETGDDHIPACKWCGCSLPDGVTATCFESPNGLCEVQPETGGTEPITMDSVCKCGHRKGFHWHRTAGVQECGEPLCICKKFSVATPSAPAEFKLCKCGLVVGHDCSCGFDQSAPTEAELPQLKLPDDPESWYILTITGVVQKIPAKYENDWWYWADAEADPCPSEIVESWVEVGAALQQIAALEEKCASRFTQLAQMSTRSEIQEQQIAERDEHIQSLANNRDYASLLESRIAQMKEREEKAVEILREEVKSKYVIYPPNSAVVQAISLLTSQEGGKA